jgi:hypothetical protein
MRHRVGALKMAVGRLGFLRCESARIDEWRRCLGGRQSWGSNVAFSAVAALQVTRWGLIDPALIKIELSGDLAAPT